jgi:ferredoxin-NADP reductase
MCPTPRTNAPRSRLAPLPSLGRLADAFAWPLRSADYLALVAPRWGGAGALARIVDLREETPRARTLTLRPARRWPAHRAGQHVQLGVAIDGRRHVRTYSLSSAPERFAADGCVTVTVTAVEGGRVSAHLVRDARAGDRLWLGPPQGEFVLRAAGGVRPLFVTAGSGITPVMSMLRSLAAAGALPDVAHLHYARTPGDVIFGAELAALAGAHPRYRLHVLHTRVSGAPGDGPATFGPAALAAHCPDWREREAFVCGPLPLLVAAEAHWSAAGLAPRLHVERFHASLAPALPGAAGGRVRFARSGVEVEAGGGTSLLRVAQEAGLRPPHGCRMGICHSCSTTLRAGRVRDLRDHAVIDEPGAKVQLCVCAASGNVELEL